MLPSHPRRTAGLLAGFAAVATLLLAPVASASDPVVCSAGAATMCTDSTVGQATWTVPPGVERVLFTVFGGGGGSSLRPGGRGGAGGETSASFAVRPGQVFELYVGARGGDGPNVFQSGGTMTVYGCQAGYGAGPSEDGCGGDGSDVASAISNDPGPRILVSAGGGGGGGGNSRGGDGGGLTGLVAPAAPDGGGGAFGGKGATATSGGMGGTSFDGHPPINGSNNGAGGTGYGPVTFDPRGPINFQTQNHGGAASGGSRPFDEIPPGDYSGAGGGGGGGYYGGGGGGDCSEHSTDPRVACGSGGGGGGGGSAFVDPSATTVTGFNGGNSAGSDGKIQITFTAGASATPGPTPAPNPTPTPNPNPSPSPAPSPAPNQGGNPRCIVPNLKGSTLSQAKRLLSHAHCALGKVRKPKARKGHKLGKLIVSSQSLKAGSSRPAGTKVNVQLGLIPKKHHRS